MVKIVFHVLFLVLETKEEKIEQTTYAFHKLIYFGGLVRLFRERGRKHLKTNVGGQNLTFYIADTSY